MKKMDTDANQLARTHIDDVEQLLQTNSSLHANEVDSLLSEINDFLHLRSRELSKGKSVNYMDVVEALGMNLFIDPKDSQRLLREVQLEMKEMIRKYNDLVID